MRKILVVVDMQNDFIDGSLGTKEACDIVDNVVAKIGEYNNSDIYATRDTHLENYLDTNEGKHLPVVHCVKGTYGWQINDRVAKVLGNVVVIDKPCFGSVELANILSEENKKEGIEIELVGLCTDICVVSNALILKAYMPEVKIKVDSFCCAGVTPQSHKNALDTMKMCQIEVVD